MDYIPERNGDDVRDIAQAVARQRKFSLALIFSFVTSVALFMDKLSGSEYVSAITLILGLYGLANVGQRFVDSK